MKSGKRPTEKKGTTWVNYAIVPPINHKDLTAMDLLVWFALCSFARWEWDEGAKKPIKGTCNPGRGTLAKRALCTVRTVTKSLKDLEELGFIKRTRTMAGNRWGVNNYILTPIPDDRELRSIGNDVPYGDTADNRECNSIGNDVPYDRECSSLLEPRNRERGAHKQYIYNSSIERTVQEAPAPGSDSQNNVSSSDGSISDTSNPDISNPDTLTPPLKADDTNTSQEERPLTADNVKELFAIVWGTYPNHGKEAAGLRAFRKLIPVGTQRQVAQDKISDLTARLDEALEKRWTNRDTGELEEQFVPYLSNFLGDNYDL